jgi:hypothetical protein
MEVWRRRRLKETVKRNSLFSDVIFESFEGNKNTLQNLRRDHLNIFGLDFSTHVWVLPKGMCFINL